MLFACSVKLNTERNEEKETRRKEENKANKKKQSHDSKLNK